MASKPPTMKPYDVGEPELPSVRFNRPPSSIDIDWAEEADEKAGSRCDPAEYIASQTREVPPTFPVRSRKGDMDSARPAALPDPMPFKGLTSGRGK